MGVSECVYGYLFTLSDFKSDPNENQLTYAW